MKLFNIRIWVLACLLVSISSVAQTVIKIPQIDLISYYNHGSYTLYHKKSENTYYAIYLNFGSSYNRDTKIKGSSYSVEIAYDDPFTLEDIEEDSDVIIKTDALKNQSLSEFQQYLLQNSWRLSGNNQEETILLTGVNPAILSIAELKYGTSNFGGFGAYEEDLEDDLKLWRPYDVKFVNTIYIEINSQTYFAIFNNNYDDKGFFLPLKGIDVVIDDIFHTNNAEKLHIKDSLAQLDIKYFLNSFDAKDFYQLKELQNGKIAVINNFGDFLIDNEFDSISFNAFFIIGKEDDKFKVFKNDFDEVDFGIIKIASIYRSGLELLNENGANYYDYSLNKIDEFPRQIILVCGTVSHTNYKLEYNRSASIPYSIVIENGDFEDNGLDITYFIRGIDKNATLSFLDNSFTQYRDDNDQFLPYRTMPTQILKVEKDNKFGLVEYDIDKAKFREPKPEYSILKNGDSIKIPAIGIKEGSVHVSELLAIEYDSIIFNEEENQIFIYKNEKVGLYPQHDDFVYDTLEPKTNSFYYFTKNGQKGYLDRKSGLEYLDK